jgi:hypothetical protein
MPRQTDDRRQTTDDRQTDRQTDRGSDDGAGRELDAGALTPHAPRPTPHAPHAPRPTPRRRRCLDNPSFSNTPFPISHLPCASFFALSISRTGKTSESVARILQVDKASFDECQIVRDKQKNQISQLT